MLLILDLIAKHSILIVIIKVFVAFFLICFSGSTLVIMHSPKEPNSFFGGMAVPSWSHYGQIKDPVNECSWLFKLEAGEN